MQALKKGPKVPTLLASVIISVLVGGVAGFYTCYYLGLAKPKVSGLPPGGGPGIMGGMMGGAPGQDVQQKHPNTMALMLLVRNLVTLEEEGKQGLSTEQAKNLLPILKFLQAEEKMTEEKAKSNANQIWQSLTDEQQLALATTPPRFGGGGMGGMMGGMGGGGAQFDPQKPFAQGRSKEQLDQLIELVSKKAK